MVIILYKQNNNRIERLAYNIMIYRDITLYCALQVDSTAMREVKKDLHRTLPNNRHFKSGGVGVNSKTRYSYNISSMNTEVMTITIIYLNGTHNY